METATHLDHLVEHGLSLAAAVDAAGLELSVDTCPGWALRDLVQHVGQVHRWAMSFITTGRTTPPNETDQPAEPPADDELLAWFRSGHAALVDALQSAPDDLDCWAFLPAPSPRAFWTRRQAHETAIHRADAELAAGKRPTFNAAFAVDGIDELLLGFYARQRGRLRSDPAVRLGLRTDDTGDAWTMTIGPESRSTTKTADPADCVVSGNAADLYLMVWNRIDTSALDVDGDKTVLELWREKARVTFR